MNDLNNMFQDSYVQEAFSLEGINTLLGIAFWEMYMFYILIIKTVVLIAMVRRGYSMDKADLQKKLASSPQVAQEAPQNQQETAVTKVLPQGEEYKTEVNSSPLKPNPCNYVILFGLLVINMFE